MAGPISEELWSWPEKRKEKRMTTVSEALSRRREKVTTCHAGVDSGREWSMDRCGFRDTGRTGRDLSSPA